MNRKTSTKELSISSNEKLSSSNASRFKPRIIKNLKPHGLKIFSFNAGFKMKNNDLLIIIFDRIVNVQCAYSLTSTPSAPIIWDKNNNKGECKVLIINSGNANAHTGNRGIKIIEKYVLEIIKKLKCNKSQVLVSSTGVIGEVFNPLKIIRSIKKIKDFSNSDLLGAAKAIMTTDTYPKTYIKTIKIQNKKIKIYGFVKGSGMIQPNMGTMLAYIFIECELTKKQLKKLLKENIDDTFNSISVDGDTSTSDTLMLFSVPKNNINIDNKKNYDLISKSLFDVMHNLSSQVIKDGEGVSKIIEVKVIKARNLNQAKNIGFSIINSPLVKTAIAGEDANWGRIIMAIGKSYENIDQNKIQVSFGNHMVCKKGAIYNNINFKKLDNYMKKDLIQIKVDLGLGKFKKTVVGNDLTYEYVRINADYRS